MPTQIIFWENTQYIVEVGVTIMDQYHKGFIQSPIIKIIYYITDSKR